MKKLALSMLVAVAAFSANANASNLTLTQIMRADIEMSAAAAIHTNNVINWKVGEFQENDLSAVFGNMGTMKKVASAEEGNAIWIKSEVTGMMSQTVEELLDRADGHVIKYKENGQEKPLPTDKIEIISQDATTVTVPAGTFECIHIVAKSEKIKSLEVWANPRDITLDGSAKAVIDAGMITVTVQLTKQGGR